MSECRILKHVRGLLRDCWLMRFLVEVWRVFWMLRRGLWMEVVVARPG